MLCEIICIILFVNRLNFSLISEPHLKQMLRFSYIAFILDHRMGDFLSRLGEGGIWYPHCPLYFFMHSAACALTKAVRLTRYNYEKQ